MFGKISLFVGVGLLVSQLVEAQDDPVALKIGDRTIVRSELAEAYKSYVADEKDKRKTVDLFVQQFVELQKKAMTARAEKLDTSENVRTVLDTQKSRLLRPLFLTEAEKEAEALRIYTATKTEFAGKPLLKVAAIFRYLPQDATPARVQRERALTDSLYNELLKGADFLTLATRYSTKGGQLSDSYVPFWLATGKTWMDYETQAYALKPGEFSKPFLSVRGFYIVKLIEQMPFPVFEAVKARLVKYMDESGITSRLIQEKFEQMRKNSGVNVSAVQLKHQIEKSLWQKNPSTYRQYSMYADAVLAAEWDKVQKDNTTQIPAHDYPVTVHEKVVRTLERDY